MKKQGDIASLFRNHAAKKQKFIASSLSLDVTQASTPQEQVEERINEEIVDPMPSALPPPTLYDVSCLPHDSGERQPIASTILMITMQFEEHIFLEVHFNHMDMNSQIGKLEIEIAILILCGFKIFLGLNIVSRKMLHFALCATYSKVKQIRAKGLLHLLQMVGIIGIKGPKHF
jgi:hypothetical protein